MQLEHPLVDLFVANDERLGNSVRINALVSLLFVDDQVFIVISEATFGVTLLYCFFVVVGH